MERVICPILCETFPVRERIDGEPIIIAEIGFQALGQISSDGRTASFEFRNGLPVGERTSTIGIANEKGRVGSSFFTEGSNWDSGRVVEEFEKCEGPIEKRKGFLNRRKYLGCTAIENL